ncbi:MAG: AAA family ATPase [Oscillospiraceae bacterium]|jgi:uncharacterized protein YhaN|nr:AAA family ATPase [Oscillospiraceae bacterium]
MRIKKLSANFGTLNERALELKDGLNIIEGANESGKSTWCAFIRAMLFGVDSSQRDTKSSLAEKNRFRPWGGAPMSGRLTLETGGEEITLERRSQANMPMRELQAFNRSGEELGFNERQVGEYLLGVGRETFEKSAFIERPELPSSGVELEKKILSLVSTGSDSYSFTDAEERLKDKRNSLRYNRRGIIPDLEARKTALTDEIALKEESEKELVKIQEEIVSLEKDSLIYKSDIEFHEYERRAEEQIKLGDAVKSLTDIDSEIEAMSKALPDADEFELRNLAAELSLPEEENSIEEEKKELERNLLRLSELSPFYGCPAENASGLAANDIQYLRALQRKLASKRNIAIYILSVTASLIFLFVSLSAFPAAVTRGISAEVILLVTFILCRLFFVQRKRQAIFNKYDAESIPDITISLESYKSLYREAEVSRYAISDYESGERQKKLRRDAAFARAKELFPDVTSADKLLSETDKALLKIRRYEETVNEAKAVAAVVDTLKSRVMETPDAAVSAPRRITSLPHEDVHRRYNEVIETLAVKNKQASYLEGILSGESGGNAPYELKRVNELLEAMSFDYQAAELALDALSAANAALRGRLSPALNEKAAEIFSAFTAGKYDRVQIDREFSVMAGDSENAGLHKSFELSRGASDQLWLAIRLAICEVVLPPDKNIPVILDDALVTFDSERLGYVLDRLCKEAQTRQILLFTCQDRERRYLEGRDVNIIDVG